MGRSISGARPIPCLITGMRAGDLSGAQHIEHRPFGNIAVMQRIGTDLRFALDRASYGNILALTQEVGHYLSSVLDLLDTPDIKKSFDANTKWDVIEIVFNRHLGTTHVVKLWSITAAQ